MHGTNVTVI